MTLPRLTSPTQGTSCQDDPRVRWDPAFGAADCGGLPLVAGYPYTVDLAVYLGAGLTCRR